MRIEPDFHVTYCSNIHAGETWQDVSEALAVCLPRVRAHLGLHGPLGVGLRLSAAAAETLDRPDALARFKDFLTRDSYYVFTLNGFPFGAFHGTRVKERVYSPDWRDPARLDYTNRLARLQAAFLSGHSGIEGSVSTVPGAFRRDVKGDDDVSAIGTAILLHAAHLVRLREETGIVVTLGLEPEPACFLETIDDAVTFFEAHLFDRHAVAAASTQSGVQFSVDDVRRHVGVCFDACHMAVEFEEPASALERLKLAGIRVTKVQLSSALRVPNPADPASLAFLEQFAEDTYLHQVVRRSADGLVRYTDLPEVLDAARRRSPEAGEEWRVHFHVPIFLAEAGHLRTTQPYLTELLRILRRDRVCPYLEVETYTWNVLPPELREEDVCVAIARELAWVRSALTV
jgi:sugar phosphate isomerase/epimerase